MNVILEKLTLYFQYPFVRYALIVGVLISLCSSLLGVTLVLKRFSFIGDGLSHVAFGAMAIAAVFNLTNEMPLVLLITIVSAILLLRTGQNAKIKGDAAVAMISVGSLAIGYLLMNLFSSSSNLSGDVCSTLFGSTSILTLTETEVWLSAVLSLLVVVVFVFFYNKIFAVTFDESFARATGVKTGLYNLLIAVVIAVIMVYEPESYEGKTVKLTGLFSAYEANDKLYLACIVPDATACCAQGLEFELKDSYTYPDDFPENGSEITVAGTFTSYTEEVGGGSYVFLILKDAVLL